MKKLIYVIAGLIMAFSLSANAQSLDKMNSNHLKINDLKIQNTECGLIAPYSSSSDKSEKTQAVLTWENINISFGRLQFSLYQRCTPIVYDPVSNLVMIVASQFQYKPGTPNSLLSHIIGGLYYKAPTGMRWDSLKLFNEAEMGVISPSLAINNDNNATTMANMNLTLVGRYVADYNQWAWSGLGFSFKTGTTTTSDLNDKPDINNPGNQYSWGPVKVASNGKSAESYTSGSLMISMNTTVPGGAYGFLSSDVNSQTVIHSKLPTEWAMSQFRAAPELTQSYNAGMEIATDNDNNIYCAVNNLFADDEENRIPAVTMSDDGGANWSTFNRMPASLIENYKGSYTAAFPYEPYNSMNGFVAWGLNSYSYFYPLVLFGQDTAIHLVEAKFNGVEWTLTKVADMNGVLPVIFWDSELYPSADDKFKMDYDAYLGYEIQAAKTADGQYLVVKYIDQGLNPDGSGKVALFNPAIPITMDDANGQEQDRTLSSMAIHNIYIARRKLDSPNWNVVNASNDDRSYKATWIPSIVPDVNNIPILTPETPSYADQTNPFNALPEVMRDRIIDFFAYFLNYTRFTDPISVEETTSNNSFRVFDVYPNPVTDLVEFTYELRESSNVRIELFNSLGQSLSVILDNQSSEGIHGINADLSNLPSGVYYYTLTANGNSATKVLNVVK